MVETEADAIGDSPVCTTGCGSSTPSGCAGAARSGDFLAAVEQMLRTADEAQ
ncbi:MAG TPA: hypothetical protein VK471_05395 [Solirubrobacterales bacterium]|nr:hypothetical protein [Solirubrobacterales bacterium]